MSNTNRRAASRLARQATELMFATPQVVAHRVMRMAAAGAAPGLRDRQEFRRMGAEKTAAFNESWSAMAAQTARANQQLALSAMSGWYSMWLGAASPRAWINGQALAQPLQRAAVAMQGAALGVMSSGLAPVRKRAVANARRLGRG